jgi:hypothetical protein
MGPKTQKSHFLASNDPAQVSVIYGNHLPKQNSTDGTCSKVNVRALEGLKCLRKAYMSWLVRSATRNDLLQNSAV